MEVNCGLKLDERNLSATIETTARSVIIPHQVNVSSFLTDLSIPEIEKLLQISSRVRNSIPLSHLHNLHGFRKANTDSHEEFDVWSTWFIWKIIGAAVTISFGVNLILLVLMNKCLSHKKLIPIPTPLQKRVFVLNPKANYGTFSFEDSLPKLPVPSLEETLSKYLKSVQPFVTEEELTRTKIICEKFGASPRVQELQRLLEKRAEEKHNWLADW